MLALCTAFDFLQTQIHSKSLKRSLFHIWTISFEADYKFHHLHHACKSQTKMMPFHVWTSVARIAFTEKGSHCLQHLANEDQTGWFPLLKRHSSMLRDAKSFFWGWYYSNTFQVTGKTTANIQCSPSPRNKGNFHIHNTREDLCFPFSYCILRRKEQGCGFSSPEPKQLL